MKIVYSKLQMGWFVCIEPLIPFPLSDSGPIYQYIIPEAFENNQF